MSSPVVGLIMGVIFGASLVLTGLTDPDKIIGALRLKDFYAIRTVAFFVLVAMFGTWILGLFGAANLNVEPAVILTLLIGGALLGIGLGLTGFGPATGLASAASGRIDALVTVIGMIFGAHVYILIYPSIVMQIEKMYNYGSVTLPQITGVSATIWVVSIFVVGSLVLLITRSMQPRFDEGGIGAIDLSIKPGGPQTAKIAFGEPPEFADAMGTKPVTEETGLYIRSDCLKAAYVFRRWKNLLFIVLLLCLLLNQASFWLISTGQVKIAENPKITTPIVSSTDNIQAGQAAAPAEKSKSPSPWLFGLNVTFEHLTSIIRTTAIILVLASAFYALIMYFGMGVSFKGRLGGIGHICGAFYISLIMFVLIMPWQNFFGQVALGATYTPQELVKWYMTDVSGTFGMALFYLRFTGYWALVLLLLLLAQLRSIRWARAIRYRFGSRSMSYKS
jgi:hypothetical protein